PWPLLGRAPRQNGDEGVSGIRPRWRWSGAGCRRASHPRWTGRDSHAWGACGTMSNEWTKPEHSEAYLARMKDIPHRVEGEATLLSEVPVQTKRVLDLGCVNGHLLSLVLKHCP